MTTTVLESLIPLTGYCLIVPDDLHEEVEGGIVIPERVAQRMGGIGKVIAIAPRDHQQDLAEDLLNRRCIMEGGYGRAFEYKGQRCNAYPIDKLLAVLEGDGLVEVMPEGLKRCRYCKTGKDGCNALIMNGKCSVCGKDEHGETPKETEREAHRKLNERLARKDRGKASGNVFGYRANAEHHARPEAKRKDVA